VDPASGSAGLFEGESDDLVLEEKEDLGGECLAGMLFV
jgi:hypothetical protein